MAGRELESHQHSERKQSGGDGAGSRGALVVLRLSVTPTETTTRFCKSREAGSYCDIKAGEKSTSSKVRLSNPQTRAAAFLVPKAQVRNIHKSSLPFSHKTKAVATHNKITDG